ncbi:MAG TPA: MATE family efflux transporter [Clostridiales bacterium]|nr:MATE family efflux transporter [Clostridiales bacterium]
MAVKAVKNRKHEIDMTEGKLFPKIFAFAVPLILTAVLQLLFNSADMIVVGKFVGNNSVGAVGSTGSLNALLTNFAIGLSVGAGVVLASAFGAKDSEYGDKILHTSMVVSVIAGVIFGALGYFVSRPLLSVMGTPVVQLDDAATYLEIICLGCPFSMIYNFGASMLRATGDTKRPLIYLTVAGVINIIVNIVTVVCFNMGVSGVAIATIFSQAVSAVLVVITLLRNKGFVKLSLKKLRIHGKAFGEIMRLGVPTGIQSMLFNISNVLLQSAINGFGSDVVNGCSLSSQIEGYVYSIMSSISATALTAVGQNYGAHDYKRIKKCIYISVAFVTAAGIIAGGIAIAFHEPLCRIFTNSGESAETTEKIISYAFERMLIIAGTYFLDGIMEVITYSLRGVGYSITSMLIVLVGTCAFRVLWIFGIFPLYRHLWFLFMLYPISWAITLSVAWIWLEVVLKRDEKKVEKQSDNSAAEEAAAV